MLLCCALLFLQSCQHNEEENQTIANKKQNLQVAAKYNVQLGLAYLKQGHISRSKRKLLTAMKQAPNSADVNAAMGYFMEKTGDFARATKYYQTAMSLAPGRGTQLNNYGAFLCRHGKYEQAESYFLKAVQDVQYEHTSGAYENAGLCALSVHDKAKAERYFKQALAQDPSRKQSLFELLKIEMKNKQYNEVLTILNKHPELVLRTREFLEIGQRAASSLGKTDLETYYHERLNRLLNKFGVNHNDRNPSE